MTRMILAAAILAAGLGLAPGQGAAQAAPDDALRATFLPGAPTGRGTHMAGLRLTLGTGWKTYWRVPGEGGLAPEFDWSGSTNLAQVRIHWPRPIVFDVGGLRSIGYAQEVILPIEITPRDPAKPVTLAARVDLGVCSDVCLPVSFDLAVPLPATATPDKEIAQALALVPARVRPAAIHCAVDPLRDGLRISAAIDIASTGGTEVVVMELADSSIWVSEARSARQGGRLSATADMVPGTAQPFALDRSTVTITILGTDRAVEISGCPS